MRSNKAKLDSEVATLLGKRLSDVKLVTDEFVAAIVRWIKKDEIVTIPNLGTFRVQIVIAPPRAHFLRGKKWIEDDHRYIVAFSSSRPLRLELRKLFPPGGDHEPEQRARRRDDKARCRRAARAAGSGEAGV